MAKKRINLIVKGKGLVNELLGIKERRIRRALSSAQDLAEENVIKCKDDVLAKLNELGEVEDQDQVNNILNDIFDILDSRECYKTRAEQVKEIMTILEEEVDEEE